MVEQIDRAGPRAIGIDILFDSPTERLRRMSDCAEVLQSARSPLVIADAGLSDGLTEEQVSYLQSFAPIGEERIGCAIPRSNRRRGEGFLSGSRPGRHLATSPIAGACSRRWAAAEDREGSSGLLSHAKGTPHGFPTYPAESIGLLPPDWLSGKFVLIGADLPAEDRHLTPFAALDGVEVGSLPGVVIHAHSLAQNLRNFSATTISPLWLADFPPGGCRWLELACVAANAGRLEALDPARHRRSIGARSR